MLRAVRIDPHDLRWVLDDCLVVASESDEVKTRVSGAMQLKPNDVLHTVKLQLGLPVFLVHMLEHVEEAHVGVPAPWCEPDVAASLVELVPTRLFFLSEVVELEADVEAQLAALVR